MNKSPVNCTDVDLSLKPFRTRENRRLRSYGSASSYTCTLFLLRLRMRSLRVLLFLRFYDAMIAHTANRVKTELCPKKVGK